MAKKDWVRSGLILQIISWLYTGLVLYAFYTFINETLSGVFEDIEFSAWIWMVSSMFPLLFVSMYLNFNVKLTWREFKRSYFIVYHFSIGLYAIILIYTFKEMPVWVTNGAPDDSERAIDDYIAMSYLWLIPCQIVLFVLIGLIIKNSRALIKMDRSKVIELEQVVKQIHIENKEKKAYQLLLDSKFPQLFDFLEPFIQEEEEMKTFFLIKNRYNRFFQTSLRRTESIEYLNIVNNQISSDLIEIIRRCFPSKN